MRRSPFRIPTSIPSGLAPPKKQLRIEPSVVTAPQFKMKHERSTLPTPTSTNSFWHSEPNQFLLGHRTTDVLPADADIVIIGSGITGTSAARYLAEDERARGKSIVMLEAREACWGATGRVSLARPWENKLTGFWIERRPLPTASLRSLC